MRIRCSFYPQREPRAVERATSRRVPHISLVFREMWDTTDVDREVHRVNRESKGKSSSIPHLAKNERDVGHPSFVGELEVYLCGTEFICSMPLPHFSAQHRQAHPTPPQPHSGHLPAPAEHRRTPHR